MKKISLFLFFNLFAAIIGHFCNAQGCHYSAVPVFGTFAESGNIGTTHYGPTFNYSNCAINYNYSTYIQYANGHVKSKILSAPNNSREITIRVQKCSGNFTMGNVFKVFVLELGGLDDNVIECQQYTINSVRNYVDITTTVPLVSVPCSLDVFLYTSNGDYKQFAGRHILTRQSVVNTSSSPSDGGNTSGDDIVRYNSSVTVHATPSSGYEFSHWEKNGYTVSHSSDYTFIANSDNINMVAYFDRTTNPNCRCSDITTLTSNSGTFSDRNCDNEYQNDLDCKWLINPSNASSITLSFSRFSTEQNYDEVIVYDGSTVNSTVLGRFSGSNLPSSISSSGNAMLVRFNTDHSVTSTGWTANYVSTHSYTITTSAEPSVGGSVSGGGTFNHGSSVTVTASPNPGYSFVCWKEGNNIVNYNQNYTFTATQNRSLVAYFTLQNHNLTLTADPPYGGSVTGGGSVSHGSTVTISAVPASNYTFSNWTEGGGVLSTASNYQVQVNNDRTIVAHFTPIQYTVNLSAVPGGGGSVTGGGTFSAGTLVTITATPNNGFVFSGWYSGNTMVNSSASYTFPLNENKVLSAHFSQQSHTVALRAEPVVGGSVTGGGTFNHGATTTICATPTEGYQFVNWTESGSNTQLSINPNYTITVNNDRTIVGHFSRIQYTVTLNALPSVGGNVSGAVTSYSGMSVTVAAVPNPGYVFDGWYEGDSLICPISSYTFILTRNRNLSAHFRQQVIITAVANPLAGGDVTGDGTFSPGDVITLTAIPAPDYEFVNWKCNNVIVSSTPVYTFTASNANQTYVANFFYNPPRHELTLSVEPENGGFVSGAGSYTQYETVNIIAIPNPCYTFSHWSKNGVVFSYSNNEQVSIQNDEHYVAHFIHNNMNSIGTIFGPDQVCENGSATYNVAPVDDALIYYWTKPDGTTLLTQEPMLTFVVTPNMESGWVSVYAHNDCGNSDTAMFAITVNPRYDSVVYDTTINPYSWEGGLYTEPGEYQVTYPTIAGCDSTIRLVLYFTMGVNEQQKPVELLIYPNPTSGKVWMEFGSEMSLDGNRMVVVDDLGRQVYDAPVVGNKVEIDLNIVPTGNYQLVLKQGDKILATRTIIKK